jgi:hypothetical protein
LGVLSDSHTIGDYKLTWDLTDQILHPTKSVLIEDIEDSPPHTMQEASKLMAEATLGETLDAVDFKPVTGKALILPEGKLVEDIESFINSPELLATPAPTNPRKKLVLLDEDEL